MHYDLDSPVQRILARRDVLALDVDQVRNLNLLEIEFCKEAVQLLSRRQLLELDIRRAGFDSQPGLGVTSTSLASIDAVTAELRQHWLTTCQRALSRLSPEQLSKLSDTQIAVPTYAPSQGALESTDLDSMVSNAVAARIKDARVVEIETAQAIAERFLAWAKSVAMVTAVPLALLAAVLGITGFSNWTDFNKKIDAANKEIDGKIEAARHKAKDIDDKANALDAQYAKLEKDLSGIPNLQANISSLTDKYHDLSGKVDQLEHITVEQRAQLPAAIQEHLGEIKAEISKEISDYRSYLQSIGYTIPTTSLSVEISGGDDYNAYFDGAKIVVGSNMVRMPDVIYREYTLRMLKEVNPNTYTIGDWKAAAIVSGLADYFPCSYRGDPKFGVEASKLIAPLAPTAIPNGYLRNLANDRQFVGDDAPPAAPAGQASTEMHNAGEVWGGAFWDVRRILGCKDEVKGCQKADRILLASVPSLKAAPEEGVPFAASIIDNTGRAVGDEEAKQVHDAFAKRGLSVLLRKN
jgi:hypothetical protein